MLKLLLDANLAYCARVENGKVVYIKEYTDRSTGRIAAEKHITLKRFIRETGFPPVM